MISGIAILYREAYAAFSASLEGLPENVRSPFETALARLETLSEQHAAAVDSEWSSGAEVQAAAAWTSFYLQLTALVRSLRSSPVDLLEDPK